MGPVDGGQTRLALGATVDFVAVLILCGWMDRENWLVALIKIPLEYIRLRPGQIGRNDKAGSGRLAN